MIRRVRLKGRFIFYAVLVFGVGALLGPLLGLAKRLYLGAGKEIINPEIESLVGDVINLLMPSRILGVFEYSVGKVGAWVIVLGVHFFLYILMGVVVAVGARWLVTYFIAIALLISYVVVLSLWGAGFEYEYVDGWALAIALSFYGSLALLAGWIMRRNRALRGQSAIAEQGSQFRNSEFQ